jgi:hypothetical protein
MCRAHCSLNRENRCYGKNEEQAVRAVGDLASSTDEKYAPASRNASSPREYESAYRELISAGAGHSAAARGAKAERRLETKLTDEPPVPG